jgi:low temperature requirement protein LtrA
MLSRRAGSPCWVGAARGSPALQRRTGAAGTERHAERRHDHGWPGSVRPVTGFAVFAPPRVRAEEPERTATRLELFFDLAFVVALGELALHFADDLGVGGWLWSIGTFVALWWVWAGFTVYANRFDSDDVLYRVGKLAAMAGVLGCAAALPTAPSGVPVSFVLCYAGTQLLLALLYLRAARHLDEAAPVATVYLAGLGAGIVLWLAALPFPPVARGPIGLVAVLVAALAPVLGRRRTAAVTLHLDHLPERVALLVILVLGEVTAACVLGLKEAHWTAASTVAAGLAFLLGAALWWLYFDTAGAATTTSLQDAMDDDGDDDTGDPAEESGEEAESTSAFDLYLYGQLPATLGLLVAGVGIEHAVAEAGKDALPWATLLPMCAGIALYLLALSGTQSALRAAASRDTLWPLAGAAAALAVVPVGRLLPPPVVVGLVAVVVVATLALGLQRRARGAMPVDDSA